MRIAALLLTAALHALALSNVVVQDITSRQARWTWTTTSTSGCGLVEWGTVSGAYTFASWLPCQFVSATTRGYVASNLQPGTRYFYRVRQFVSGSSGAEEAGSPSAEASFDTPNDDQIEPLPPTLYQPTAPTVNGSTLAVTTCGSLQGQINAAAALNAALVHEVVVTAGLNCAAPVILPAKAGAGWVVVRSSAAGGATSTPRGTRVTASDAAQMATISVYGSSTNNYQGLSVAGAPSGGTEGWWFHGVRLVAATVSTPLAVGITAMTQGASSVCGTAANTWSITTASAHGLSALGWIAMAQGVAGFTSAPTLLRGYSTPTETTLVACSIGAGLGGSYTGGGTLHVYGGLAISSAVSSGGTSTITTASAHGLTNGTFVTIQGFDGLNGTHQVTRTGATTFTVPATHGAYSSGAVMSYGPGMLTALVELTETTSRIVFEQSILGCEFPHRCLVPLSTAGGRSINVRDSLVIRTGWSARPIANDFLANINGTNLYEGGGGVEASTAGPLTIENTAIVATGINVFAQGGRATLLPRTGGLAILNSSLTMDQRCVTSSATYTGLLCLGRHLIELKAQDRMLVTGNYIGDFEKNTESVAPSDVVFAGVRCEMTPCNDTNNVMRHLDISGNWFNNTPSILGLAGGETRGDGQPPPTHHIRLSGNLITNLNGYLAESGMSPGNGALVRFWNIDALTVVRNSVVGRVRGGWPSLVLNHYVASSRFRLVGNMLAMNNDSNRAGYTTDTAIAPTPALVTTMPGLIASQYPAGALERNIIIPGVESSSVAANCFGSTAGACDYTVAEATSYFAGTVPGSLVPGATADARIAAVGWLADGRLAHTSAYAGYGAAIEPIIDAMGAARWIGISTNGSTITVRWYAPSAGLCSVDRSNDNWATWTRVSGTAGTFNRSQSASFTSVPSGSWSLRVHCPSSSKSGGVTTAAGVATI